MFDFGKFVEDLATKVANKKGYDNVGALISDKASAEVARITDRANETKQTTPLQGTTAYTMEVLNEQGAFGLTRAQLLIAAGLGATALFLVLRR